MRQIIIILLFLTQLCFPAVALNKTATIAKYFKVSINEHEKFITSPLANSQMGVFTSAKGKIIFLGKEFEPQSVKSVKIRAIEEGVNTSTIKIKKYKDRSLFYYETADFYKVYSTLGGELLIAKNKSNIFDFSKLNLQDKKIRKVAKL